MKKNTPFFSVIIPVRNQTDYLKQTKHFLSKQIFSKFELLVVTDKISQNPNPAFKRNLGAQKAKGQYLAFLDDDSYPDQNWLASAKTIINQNPSIAAVCGPALTPPKDNILKKASGLIWSSWLGSGGAGLYRNSIQPKRFVDDYPTVNLIVKKTDFFKAGGFDTHHWPGEDTVLCLNLTKKLNKKILYHPSIIVYHHRRAVVWPHLKQITRYAIHRGFFVKKYPQTSFRLGYFIPSLFTLYLIILPIINIGIKYIPLYLYISILLITWLNFIIKKNNPLTSTLAVLTIPLTHIYYGLLFVYGLLLPQLKFTPHKINSSGNYHGG